MRLPRGTGERHEPAPVPARNISTPSCCASRHSSRWRWQWTSGAGPPSQGRGSPQGPPDLRLPQGVPCETTAATNHALLVSEPPSAGSDARWSAPCNLDIGVSGRRVLVTTSLRGDGLGAARPRPEDRFHRLDRGLGRVEAIAFVPCAPRANQAANPTFDLGGY